MLFENGRVDEAIAPYRKAVELTPDAPLLRIGLAQALIESGAPGANADADRASGGSRGARADERGRLAPARHRPGPQTASRASPICRSPSMRF